MCPPRGRRLPGTRPPRSVKRDVVGIEPAPLPVHRETVGQYVTDDRWGEPIYEGDLIWTDFKIHGIFTTEHKTGEVLWSTKRQAFLVKAGLTAIPIGDIIMSESKIEVRGNVYD